MNYSRTVDSLKKYYFNTYKNNKIILMMWCIQLPNNFRFVFSVLTIWFLAAVFLVLALRRLYLDEYNIDANAMIAVAAIGLLVNIM